jgi:hypothetical protein
VVLTATFVVAVFTAHQSAAQAIDPSVAIDRTGAAPGDEVLVTGGGWPNGASLVVELCGQGGLRATLDCDVSRQRTAGVGPSGTFTVTLTLGRPPVPCPCVVKATDQASRVAATAPLAVAGIPTVPLTDAERHSARTLEISSIEITGGGRWAELFGAGGRRILEVTLVNTGPAAIDAPKVTIAWGPGSRPDGFVPPPETEPMASGDTQTLTVPLDRAALTIGKQTAVVEIQGLAEPYSARASTVAYPWGLLAVALVLLQLLLLAIRNRVRHRLHRQPAHPADGPAVDQVVRSLPPGPIALDPGPPDATSGHEPIVIDLDAADPERQPTAPPPGSSHNGTSHRVDDVPVATPPPPGPVDETARVEVVALQLQARVALQQAIELSDGLLAAASARAQELEEAATERLVAAEERHREAIELLDAARARADEITVAATRAAAGALRDAGSHRAGVRQALAEIEAQRRQLGETAGAALEQVMRDLDEQVRALLATTHAAGPSGGPGQGDEVAPRAPRLGGFDGRLAHAVSLALAGSAPADTTTD